MKNEFDLFELSIRANTDRTRCLILKYRVKQTRTLLIQQRLSEEQEKQGYTHSCLGMSGRIPITDLMKVRHLCIQESPGSCYRWIFCRTENLQEALDNLKAEVDQVVQRNYSEAEKLRERWTCDNLTLSPSVRSVPVVGR